MSGLEILGLAASVIQIAELGGKLSVQLFTFTRKVKNANKSIDALSQELASTGAVLKQLGETLTKDDHVRVCSQEAITTARGLVEDTNKVFVNLQKVVLGDEKSNEKFLKGITLKQRLKFTFLESQIEQVQANLERLKSSLLVILNVLIFAEQLRNQEALPILKDQRELIKVLASEKDENERRYKRILAAIAGKPPEDGSKTSVNIPASPTGSVTTVLTAVSTATTIVDPAPKSVTPEPSVKEPVTGIILPRIALPAALERHHERIHHHSYLVQNLLSEIASLQYNLDLSTRDRMQNGILSMHWDEWSMYRLRHGHEHFEKMLNIHPDVASYWTDRLQDRFARQLEAAEAVRRRQSRMSSASSATTGPDAPKPAASADTPTRPTNLAVSKGPEHFASVADAYDDEFDSEAAFGLSAMAHLDEQQLSATASPSPGSSRETASSVRTPTIKFDDQAQLNQIATSSESGVSNPTDTSLRTKVIPTNNSRLPNNIHESKSVPLSADLEASQVTFVIALYNFQPKSDESDMLPFKKGDKIQVLDSVYKQWWRGICDGKVGLFPTNYVALPISHESEVPPVRSDASSTSETDSLARANSPKPHGPSRDADSIPAKPTTATSSKTKTQVHKHSASVDGSTVSQTQPELGLGVSNTSEQRPSSAYYRPCNPDALPAFSEPEKAELVAPLRISPSKVYQPRRLRPPPTWSSASSSGSPPTVQSAPTPETTWTHFTKARIRYISPEVLEWEKLPWLYDPIDKDYLVIKQLLHKGELDQLSQQTQVLRTTRSDKTGGADVGSENEVGSPKLKDSFVVVPAPLYSRFVGKLEYETCDTKRGDQKNPLFVKFETEGTKKGLLSKAKRKSMFYKATNVEATDRPSQSLGQRRPLPPPGRMSLPEKTPSTEGKEKKKTPIELTPTKPPTDKIYSAAAAPEAVSPPQSSPHPELDSFSPGAQSQAQRYASSSTGAAVAAGRKAETTEPSYRITRPKSPRSYQNSPAQSTAARNQQTSPYPPDAVYQNARLSGIDPDGILMARPTPLSMSNSAYQQRTDRSVRLSAPTTTADSSAYAPRKLPRKQMSKYQFEADSNDDRMEDEIDVSLDQLQGATQRLNHLANATSQEIEAQNSKLQRIRDKSGRLDGEIVLGRQKLSRIGAPVENTAQTPLQAAYEPAYYGSLPPPRLSVSEDSKNDELLESAKRSAKLKTLNEQRALAMQIKDEKEHEETLLQIFEQMQEASGPVKMQEASSGTGAEAETETETEAAVQHPRRLKSTTNNQRSSHSILNSSSQATQKLDDQDTAGLAMPEIRYSSDHSRVQDNPAMGSLSADEDTLEVGAKPNVEELNGSEPTKEPLDSDNEDPIERFFEEFQKQPLESKSQEAIEEKAKEDDLRRRGAVDERTCSMNSKGRLFIANPDLDDLGDYQSEAVLKDIEQGSMKPGRPPVPKHIQDSANFGKSDDDNDSEDEWVSHRESTPQAASRPLPPYVQESTDFSRGNNIDFGMLSGASTPTKGTKASMQRSWSPPSSPDSVVQTENLNVGIEVGDGESVITPLQPATEGKEAAAELDDIDRLILQFSSLNEGEYIGKYKSVV